mmetsp:Transcript_20437/g.60322  ORF Transcript_20437/g.60322 Transcript_20437/m.60322 type:complete len:227 (+) Transcript_20437:31-711(+)
MAQAADITLDILRRHDMTGVNGRLRGMRELERFYQAHTHELTQRTKLVEAALSQATQAAREAGNESMDHADTAFALEIRVGELEERLAVETRASSDLRARLARAESQLDAERWEWADKEARLEARVAELAERLEERRPLERRLVQMDEVIDELNSAIVDLERKLRDERAEKALVQRAILRDQQFDLSATGGFDVQTIVQITPSMAHITHLLPSNRDKAVHRRDTEI